MKTFAEFIAGAAQHGRVNVVFEGGMYSLLNELERVLDLFREAGIVFEVVGGVAVNAHILEAHRSRSFVTRDIDLLMQENDLNSLIHFAERAGYTGKKIMGGHALLLPDQHLEEAVHILFVDKKPRSSYPAANPPLRPEPKEIYGLLVPVAPLRDLVLMKLNSLRAKDEVQLQILDDVDLITPELVDGLPQEHQTRLANLRAKWREEQES